MLEGYYSAPGVGPPDPAADLSDVMVASVLCAWLYDRTGQSVLAVITFHFFQNFSGQLLGATGDNDID